ncbi:hypothetical protein PG994_009977 [Apiospora phragmitis]|uniref:TPR-like protein n=1 Tax=Apiospora phragmitis TaxID=2905665 RepID=A0ABR1TP58_9PEZI
MLSVQHRSLSNKATSQLLVDPSFHFDDAGLHFSTPVASPSESLTRFGGARRDERTIPESGASALDSTPLLYTITWKLQLRKGRITKLTEDTIEDLELAPGAYWNEVLEPELATLVQSKLPEPQYQPDETSITVSNSKRGEPPFQKRFNKLSIDWTVVEGKLRFWGNQGNNLKVAILFIYKESQPAKDGKTGRGATKKHTAALNDLVTQQEASGHRPVWRDVYQLMECVSAACTNRGFSCWRNNEKHYKLDSDIMDRLVDYAEEGHTLETHADVPQGIRDVICTRTDEAEARRLRKRKASDPLPVTVRVLCHGHRDNGPADCSGESHSAQLDITVPKDQAPVRYSDWLSAKVDNQRWRDAYKLAGEVAVDKGYDLRWLFTHQKLGRDMLVENGVLEGIAATFVQKTTLDEKDHDRLASQHELASAYLSARRISKAIEIFEHVVETRRITIDSRHNTSSQRAYLSARRISKAIEIFEHVVEVRKTTLDEKDHDRLASQHELARAYLSARRISKAIEIFEHVVEVRKTTLDEKDHDRLASEHSLASAYLSARRISKAIEIFEHVVEVQKTTLDEKDHDRLASQHELASAYLSARRISKAIEIFEHVVEVRKTTLDEKDHDRLASQHELASAYLSARRISKAIEIFEHVVEVRKTTLDEKDHDRLASQHELARAYLSARRISKAIEIFEHVVEVQKTTLDEKDHDRLASQHELASAYLSARRISKAIEIFEHVVEVRKTTLDEKDHSRLASQHELASAYLSAKRISKAIKIFEHVVEVQKTTLDEKDHDRLASQHELASAYLSARRISKAIEIFEHVVEVRKTTLDEKDHDRLASEHSLASAYLSARRISKAIEIFEHVVEVQKTTLDEKDHDRLASQHELARAYLSARRISKAIEIFEHVVEVQKTTLDEKDHDRLGSEHSLASAYLSARQARKAVDLLEHVVTVKSQLFDKDDFDRYVSINLLENARQQLEAEWIPERDVSGTRYLFCMIHI